MDEREKLIEILSTKIHPREGVGPAAVVADFLLDHDVLPVVHGHFVHDGPRFAGGVDWWHCSSCGRLVSGVETRFAYCPWCGAKMDGTDV